MIQRHRMIRAIALIFTAGLVVGIVACGGSSDTSVSTPTTSTEQASPSITAPSPELDSDSEPAPANTPPESTSSGLTSTPVVQGFVYDAYGFTLHLDEEIDIHSLGWTDAVATEDQGLLSFVYNGTNVLVLWMHNDASTATSMLADIYQTLRLVQPDNTFIPISEGVIEVANTDGMFGGFAISDSSSASVGGGLIGTWVCSKHNTAMGLTVIGSTATTLQVRFNRLLQGMEC